MQKFFVVIAIVLFSSISLAAQTAEQKPLSNGKPVEFAKKTETKSSININKPAEPATQIDGRVLRVGPTTTYLKNGLSKDEVLRLLGKPATVSERLEGNLVLSIYTFSRSAGRVLIAEFENDVLVRSRTETTKSKDE